MTLETINVIGRRPASRRQCLAPNLWISYGTSGGGRTVARVRGEIDFVTSAALEFELLRAPGPDGDLVVDLAGVTFMDSGRIRALDHVALALQARGGALRIVDPSRATQRILDLVESPLLEAACRPSGVHQTGRRHVDTAVVGSLDVPPGITTGEFH